MTIRRKALRAAGALGFACVALVVPRGAMQAGTLSLSVAPLVVEFRAVAGGSASQQVVVTNGGSQPERIIAQPMDWRTSVDGTVKVERVGAEGTSSLTDRLRLSPGDVVLAPGETRTLTLALELPATFPHDSAVYWGGFQLRAIAAQGGPTQFGPSADVVVYDTVGTPRTHVKMTQLHVTDAGHDAADLTMRMVNDGIGYVRPTIRTLVAQAGRVVSDQTENAPVVFGGATRVYEKSLTGLRPGEYALEATIDYGGSTLIQGSTTFTVR